MPNWCYNNMVVYGNPTEIKDFQSKMISAVKETEKTNHWGLFSVYKQFGYIDDKLIEYFNYHLSDKDKVKTVQECFDYLMENNETLSVNGQEVDISLHEFIGY